MGYWLSYGIVKMQLLGVVIGRDSTPAQLDSAIIVFKKFEIGASDQISVPRRVFAWTNRSSHDASNLAFHLRELSLFVRDFHLSPLRHGQIQPAEKLMIAIEDNNSFDLNAVKITNRAGVFVGHIAVDQSRGFRSMLCKSTALDIQVQANSIWTE